uniref:Nuclear pore complex protein Nup205 n=1 Tax=Kwoniella dejecticola CBS 10117 TaxID=1296121 RepID=A0A1A6AF26_9TREE|nr:nuclear pore complex protein Nup205 [Kwoniella dejecticola CBS 10117]OBR88677.1 nuclear pore complex protein Nup205 [Kwoniella dejecticola CBS 10117]
MSAPLAEWDSSLFSDLQHLLGRVVTQPTTSTLRKLYGKLEEAQPWLLNLTQLPGPNDADKQYIEKNPLQLPSGTSIHITGDILNTTNTISNALSLSQLLSAVLALQAEEQRFQYPSRSPPEVAVYLLHRWETDMLDFLRELLRTILSPDAEIGGAFEQLKDWVLGLLNTRVSLGQGKGEGALVDQIMVQLDSIQSKIDGLLRSGATGGANYDLLRFRVEALRAEQNKMSSILSVISEGGHLGRGQVVRIVKWLKKCDRADGLTAVVVSALFAAWKPLEVMDASDPRYDVAEDWCHDIKFLKIVSSLTIQDQWSLSKLRETIKIAWSLFYLSCLRHDPSVVQTGIDAHQMEQFLFEAVNGESFQFTHDLVLTIRRERGLEEPDDVKEANLDALVKVAISSDPSNDNFLFEQLRDLVDLLAGRKQFLRTLRNKEEDSAVRRPQSTPPPTNYQAFLSLMAIIYKSLPPDSAEDLWDNSTFLATVLDTRGGFPGPAFWDMLAAISTGPSCSSKSYEKMKDTRLPWTALFKFYQHYIDIMPHIFEPIKTTRNTSLDPMPHDEAQICDGWTKVLTTVVKWSPAARGALLQAKPHPIQTLFDFLNCENLPLELKATVLGAVTAFCRRTGDPIDDDVLTKAVEFYEKITFRDPGLDTRQLDAAKIPPPVGWLVKMEYSEQDASSYPLSRAYVDFLTALLPDPSISDSSTPSRSRLSNTLRRGTFYTLDGILLSLKIRRYARDSERWEVIDSLSAFFEKALLSFNMGELLNQANSRAIGQIASTLAEEPGFIVLLRLLSDANVFAVFASVLDNASATPSPRPSIVNDVLLRMLRIYHRVHDIQLVFVDVLLLTLADPTRNPTNPFRRPYGLQSLDNHLLAHLSNINAIALSVGDDDSAISYISVKIIAALAQSPVFSRSDVFRGEYTSSVNRLAGIIDASDDSIRIAQGFCRRLEAEDSDVEDIAALEDTALRGDIKTLNSLPFIIRSNILDMLVEGTTGDVTSPNLAHFLLGYDFRHRDFALQDGESCLHVILRQLCENAELGGAVGETIIEVHPLLAAKSAELIYQLFSHPLTGKSTLSYTMSVTGFSARQLASFPRICPENPQPSGLVKSFDEEIPTTSETLIAYLDYQRWILSAAALETFTYDGHGASANHIAQTLFRGVTEEEDLEDDELVAQNPALIIDALSAIDVQWIEDNKDENRNLEFYGSFDFDQYKRVDADWWDLEGLTGSLKAFRRQLERQGAVTGGSAKSMAAEAEYIVKRLASTNRETDISIAKGNFLTAWNEMLQVSLAMLFKNVAEEQQEIVLFDLIDAILLRLEGDLAPGVLDLLCESILVTMTTLINILVEFEGVNLPIDRLSATLTRIIDAAVKPGSTETARGNLYASITQYLQLVNNPSSNIPDDRSVISNESLIGLSTSTLQKATLAVFAARKERLLPILCRDAMDDREVWKTECFALMNGIISICPNERDRHILSPLISNGYLPLFVRSIKEREMSLQECLSPEHENLHAYWVFEAKIAFLMALASTRKGAEELLDAGLFEVFATCGFINTQIGEEVIDETAATEIVARQHRVLVCSLQLLTRVLSSLHRSARSGAGHALSFLNAHRETILGLLRDTQQNITSANIQETRLIVSIFHMVIHKVPAEDLHSPTGFGAFHLATLATAARYLDRDSWVEEVESPLEGEILLLNQVFLSYLTAATTGLKGGQGYPVLVTGAQRSNGATSKYIASAPSLQMAINFLSDLAENVQEVSNQYETILDRIQDGGELEDEDVQQLRTPDMLGDESLSEDAIKAAFVIKSQTMFNMIESLLLLIWRHLLFYANDARGHIEPVRPNNLSASLGSFISSQAQMEASRSGAGTIRMLERVSASLKGTLIRLDDMEINLELRRLATSTSTSKGNGAYHDMLVRRLKELVAGLLGTDANSNMEED